MAAGGSLLEINGVDPNLGQCRVFLKVDEDGTVNKGGIVTAAEKTNRDTSGTFINSMMPTNWSVSHTGVWDPINTNRQELEKLKLFTSTPNEQDWTFSWINGVVLAGKGKIVGEVDFSLKNNTFPIQFMGSGELVTI